MQFRVQGRKLQFIRSVYNKETKRCDQNLIGSMSASGDELPPISQLEKLSDIEVKELADYLAKRAALLLAATRAIKVQSSGYSLSSLAAVINTGEPITEQQATEIWDGLAAVTKAMKKAGHKKPGKTAPPPSLPTSTPSE